jgi:hypothetical protein
LRGYCVTIRLPETAIAHVVAKLRKPSELGNYF